MPHRAMRAVQCPGPGRLARVSLPVPEPGSGEIRLRMLSCGICGSDLHLLPSGYMGECIVPGHEISGEVDALGDGVEGIAPGDRVVVEPLQSCGHCRPCRRGQLALCETGRIFGIHIDGGMAEYACFPAARVHGIASRVVVFTLA